MTKVYRNLGRRPRTRCFGGLPLDSVVEEHIGSGQQHPRRNSLTGASVFFNEYAPLGGRCSYRAPPCGLISIARMQNRRVYTSNDLNPPPLTCSMSGRCLLPEDPLFKIDFPAVQRLRSLGIQASPKILEDITPQLSHSAPLLESLEVGSDCGLRPSLYPVVSTTLFGGDLSSLRQLYLHHVCTESPWRNMVNQLTSFTLCFAPPNAISTTQLLGFFESAPYLRKIKLRSSPFTHDTLTNRVVSLVRLKMLTIPGRLQTSPLIGHLSIPVGASLEIYIESHTRIEGHLPRSLDNLKNLFNFTRLLLCVRGWYREIRLTGPNGDIRVVSAASNVDTPDLVHDFLVRFDTSTVERLEVINERH